MVAPPGGERNSIRDQVKAGVRNSQLKAYARIELQNTIDTELK